MANQQVGSKGIKACPVAQWFDRLDYVPASLDGPKKIKRKKCHADTSHETREVRKPPRTHESVITWVLLQQFEMIPEKPKNSIKFRGMVCGRKRFLVP